MAQGWLVVIIAGTAIPATSYYAFNGKFHWRLSTAAAFGLAIEMSLELIQTGGVATRSVEFQPGWLWDAIHYLYNLDFDMAMFFDLTCFGGSYDRLHQHPV